MGEIGSYEQELDAALAREQQPSDHILGQLALATIMLRLELDLRAFVRALNAAQARSAATARAPHSPLFVRLLQRFASINIRFPRQSAQHGVQHSPA
jgi:hypothetical protein